MTTTPPLSPLPDPPLPHWVRVALSDWLKIGTVIGSLVVALWKLSQWQVTITMNMDRAITEMVEIKQQMRPVIERMDRLDRTVDRHEIELHALDDAARRWSAGSGGR